VEADATFEPAQSDPSFECRESVEPAISKALIVPVGHARAWQATDRFWSDIEAEFQLLTVAEVAKLIGSNSKDWNFAARLRRKGELLGVRRLNAYRYPGFQFRSDNTIHPVIKQLVAVMRASDWSEESFIFWLCSPTRAIAGGGRPVDHLDDSSLVSAAIGMMTVDW